MRRALTTPLVLALSLSASPALAQFEGRLEYQLTRTSTRADAPTASGTAVIYLAPAGARSEVSMSLQVKKDAPPRMTRLVTLWKQSEPNHVYFLSDERKAYSVMDAGEKAGDAEGVQIARLGAAKIAGYACERAQITSKTGSSQEVCVTSALGKIAVPLATDQRGVTLWNELRKAGLDGVPVSWKGAEGKEGAFSMTLTAARKTAVPAKLLEVPAGYARTSMAGTMASPEQAKQMEEAMARMKEKMKNMTPEQRKQMEKMMEQMGGK